MKEAIEKILKLYNEGGSEMSPEYYWGLRQCLKILGVDINNL